MNLNKVVLIGRISQQLSPNQSRSGLSYTRFNLAITRDSQSNNANKEMTDFIPLVAFGNNSIFLNRFFHKGDLVSVVGSIQTSQYTNKNGDLVNSFSVVVDEIKSLEPMAITQQRAERNQAGLAHGPNTQIGQTNMTKINNPSQPSFQAEQPVEEDDGPSWELDL